MARTRICFVTPEINPFAKVGGLADVSAALPDYLHRTGQDVRVFVPLYAQTDVDPRALEPVDNLADLSLQLGSHTYTYSIYRARLPSSDLTVHFVHCPELYGRSSIYTADDDEHLRFVLLCRASLECCQTLGWAPDVVHCNDWQTALIPLYLKAIYAWDHLFQATRSVLTIHNLGYQGIFPSDVLAEIGLSAVSELLPADDLHAGRVSFLKAGIVHADALTTVSPTYAREIQSESHGFGLHELLRARHGTLVGIRNGVDSEEWNPRTDPHLDYRYSVKSLWRKEKNKEALLRELNLPYERHVPVLGMVTRLTYQKGIELLFDSLPGIVESTNARFLLLGSGESKYERFLKGLHERFPQKVCFYRGYHPELAHRIEGSADMFLMPSVYEPCGLNQMYSLIYGTIPIVHKTGGLADTVRLFDPATGEGNGIVFDHPTAEGVRWAIGVALDLYSNRAAWRRIVHNAMAGDYSWDGPGAQYTRLYARIRNGVGAEV